MDLNDQKFKDANKRAAEKQSATPLAISAHYDRRLERIVVELSSGVGVMFAPIHVQGLEHTPVKDIGKIEVTPSGLGIRFPALDIDLYLPALLEGMLGTKQWMASSNGRIGGKSTSESKAASARANGRLGGRPARKAELA